MQEAIILLAHGSKKKSSEEALEILIDKIKKKTQIDLIFGAFLQFSEKDMESVIEEIIKKGVNSLKIIPLFLFDGVHVTEDIPEKLSRITSTYPEVKIKVSSSIGPDDRIAEIIIDRMNTI